MSAVVEYRVENGWVHVPDWLDTIAARDTAREAAVALEQDAAEAERLLRKVIRLSCEHGLAPVLNTQAQDALDFIARDVA